MSQDTGEAAAEKDPEGEAGRARTRGRQKQSQARTSPPASAAQRRIAAKARRDFRTGLRLLEKGRREAAIEYFDKARAADASAELAARIAAVLESSK